MSKLYLYYYPPAETATRLSLFRWEGNDVLYYLNKGKDVASLAFDVACSLPDALKQQGFIIWEGDIHEEQELVHAENGNYRRATTEEIRKLCGVETPLTLEDIPNLDAMDYNDLQEWRSDLERHFQHFATLTTYANHKARAIELRLRGQIQPALAEERLCQVLFESLPEEYRW
jgi:hypothetical protein